MTLTFQRIADFQVQEIGLALFADFAARVARKGRQALDHKSFFQDIKVIQHGVFFNKSWDYIPIFSANFRNYLVATFFKVGQRGTV